MKFILIVSAVVALFGCTMVPAGTAHRACELLRIASDEADLAPARYIPRCWSAVASMTLAPWVRSRLAMHPPATVIATARNARPWNGPYPDCNVVVLVEGPVMLVQVKAIAAALFLAALLAMASWWHLSRVSAAEKARARPLRRGAGRHPRQDRSGSRRIPRCRNPMANPIRQGGPKWPRPH